MTSVVCVIDAGTTGVRCGLVDEQGRVRAQATRDLTIEHPAPGHAEQSLDELWQVAGETLRELSTLAISRRWRIEAATIAAQRASIAALDRRGRPLTPLLLWMDQRGGDAVRAFESRVPPAEYAAVTGIPLSPMPGLASLLWLRDRHPDVFAAACRFVGVQEWLVANLTGGPPLVDESCASWVGLFDLAGRRWSEPLLAEVGLTTDRLPEIALATGRAGAVTDTAATVTGLPTGTPVYLGGGDQQCSSAGGGGIQPGAATINLGTSATFVFPVADAGRLMTGFVRAAHVAEGLTSVEGTIPACGSVFRWLRSLLRYPGGDEGYRVMMAEAEPAPPDGGGILFVPTMAGLGTPRWIPGTGTMEDLDFTHGAPALVGGAMVGIALQAREVLEALPSALRAARPLTAIGGGARSPLLCQVLADVTGVAVNVLEGDPQTAPLRGAAMCAWVGAGRHSSLHDALSDLPVARTHTPDRSYAAGYAAAYERYLTQTGFGLPQKTALNEE